MSDVVRFRYMNWMMDLVAGHDHSKLLGYLHDIVFVWSVPNDENRAMDGQDLRDKFEYSTGLVDTTMTNEPCSVLEMLVALSIRVNDIMIEINTDDETDEWFWELMNNLDLGKYTNDREMIGGDWLVVEAAIYDLMERSYDKRGVGGLFPMTMSTTDQRDVEIWYQMSEYLDEVYSINNAN